MMALAMQKDLNFFGEIKRRSKMWITGYHIHISIQRENFLNFPYATKPNFAATHTASVVMKKFVQAWKMQFNGAYNYASGRPYYNIRYDGSKYYFADMGETQDYHNFQYFF
jgi:hypothetical protein